MRAAAADVIPGFTPASPSDCFTQARNEIDPNVELNRDPLHRAVLGARATRRVRRVAAPAA